MAAATADPAAAYSEPRPRAPVFLFFFGGSDDRWSAYRAERKQKAMTLQVPLRHLHAQGGRHRKRRQRHRGFLLCWEMPRGADDADARGRYVVEGSLSPSRPLVRSCATRNSFCSVSPLATVALRFHFFIPSAPLALPTSLSCALSYLVSKSPELLQIGPLWIVNRRKQFA